MTKKKVEFVETILNWFSTPSMGRENDVDFLEDAYDEVTKPDWISVKDYTKDELPPLIDKNNPYGVSVQVLFVVVLDDVQYINKGSFDYGTGVWHSLDMQCSFCKENVTHWMPLPQAPKKGGEE